MKQIEQTLTSIEVAEMIGKEHKELLRDVRRYTEQLGESKIALTDFFQESTYKTAQNKELPCYKVTKKGCEFVAHKLTGIKGTEFTAKYINRFHEMQDAIKQVEVGVPQGKELLALAVLEAHKTIEDQTKQIDRMKPKEIFADAVAASGTSILVSDLAKILKQNGIDTGAKRLFKWLREHGYLIKRQGADYNLPTQRSMELGVFEIKETVIAHAGGFTTISKTPRVTGKGQRYFVGTFLNECGRLAAYRKENL